jgi:hypothetical protein
MFKGMKPLPKALIIAALVAAPIAAYVQFAPKRVPAPLTTDVVPVAVPAESAQPAPQPVAVTAPAPAATDAPTGLTAAGSSDAGIDNVLKAGKK